MGSVAVTVEDRSGLAEVCRILAVERLALRIAALRAIQGAGSGAVGQAVRFLTDADMRHQALAAARREAAEMIALVKTAPDNPYRTDEEIAAAILERVEAQILSRKPKREARK